MSKAKAVDECRGGQFDVVVPVRLRVDSIVTDDNMSKDCFAMSLAYCSQQRKDRENKSSSISGLVCL
jgi:hypothetical protein